MCARINVEIKLTVENFHLASKYKTVNNKNHFFSNIDKGGVHIFVYL